MRDQKVMRAGLRNKEFILCGLSVFFMFPGKKDIIMRFIFNGSINTGPFKAGPYLTTSWK